MARHRCNPDKTGIPGITGWNMYAGGTAAANGKHSYDLRKYGVQFGIDPVSSQYGRHRGYRLWVFPGSQHSGYEFIGGQSHLYRSPQSAVTAAKEWVMKWVFPQGEGREWAEREGNPTYEFGPSGAHPDANRQVIHADSLAEAQKILRDQGYDPNKFWWSRKGPVSMKGRRGQSLRPNPEPITPVIFRKFPESEGGEVIALFPYTRGSYGRMDSYMHTGQHGEASHMLVYRTKLAKPAEYASLKAELEGIGYRLKVLKREPSYRALSRAAALSREGNPTAGPSWKPESIEASRIRTIGEFTIWPGLSRTGNYRGRVYQVYKKGRYVTEFRTLAQAESFAAKRAKSNPAGPSAIPTKWTPATVSRRGGQIQIRMGGR